MSGVIRDFLGTGWAFPTGVDARGRVALVRGEDRIAQAICIILLTPRGQRVMRPEFGCRIHELQFAPHDATTTGLACYYVEEALGMWEPRIEVLSVDAIDEAETPERILLNIRYEVKSTHDSRSLVFPFYRIPDDGRER